MALSRDAQFLQLQSEIFVISEQFLVRVSPKSSGFTKLQINGSIFSTVGETDMIFVAAGRLGEHCYKYDRSKEIASLVGTTTFYILQEEGKTPFAAH
jgi:hypothetical protein